MSAEVASIGVIMRATRERLGLSQEDVAAFAGLNRTTLGEIERGEVNPTFETLARLARALGTPLSGIVKAYEEANLDRSNA